MSIPLSNVNNVNILTDMVWSSVNVETFGDDFYIYWISATVRRIDKLIQQYVSDSSDGVIDGITKTNRTNHSQVPSQMEEPQKKDAPVEK